MLNIPTPKDLLLFRKNHELSMLNHDDTPTTSSTFGISKNDFLMVFKKTDLFVKKRVSRLN